MKEKIKGALRSVIRMTREKEIVPIPQMVNAGELLCGKVALITGGSGGIGLAMAESFLKSGAKVIIAGTNEAKLQKSLEKICAGGGYGCFFDHHGCLRRPLPA